MNIRKKIQSNNSLNSFSDNYSVEEVKKLFKSIDNGEDSNNELDLLRATYLFNLFYKSYFNVIKDCIEKLHLSAEIICINLIKISNRDAYLSEKGIYEQANKNKVLDFSDINSYSTKSLLTGNNMNFVQIVECSVDICNYLFRVLKHYNFTDEEKLSEKQVIYLAHCYRGANLLTVLKDTYNELIWNDCLIKQEPNCYKIKYINVEYPIIKKIGEDRMMANEFNKLYEWKILEKMGYKANEAIIERKGTYILESVQLINGYLSCFYKEGDYTLDDNYLYTSAISQIQIYYPYFETCSFEKVESLGIIDLIGILSIISSILAMYYRQCMDNNIDVDNLDVFDLKIKRRELVKCVKTVSSYSKKEISAAIDLFSCTLHGKLDFWMTPLFKVDEDIVFLRGAITSPNIFVLIDYWLEEAGYDLAKRGTVFENYIKEDLRNILIEKNLHYFISPSHKFFNHSNNFEEIDLFINMKYVVLLAEVKCIKYPLDSIAYHNCIKIIDKAVSQVIKKKKFIETHVNELTKYSGDIAEKKIIGVVILNLTLFTGIIKNGIPICDYNLLKSYFKDGEYNEVYADGNKQINIEHKYYENEDELNNKLENFLCAPTPVSDKRSHYELEEHLVTLEEAQDNIYMDYAIKKYRKQ